MHDKTRFSARTRGRREPFLILACFETRVRFFDYGDDIWSAIGIVGIGGVVGGGGGGRRRRRRRGVQEEARVDGGAGVVDDLVTGY
jgi:hypothetical protein